MKRRVLAVNAFKCFSLSLGDSTAILTGLVFGSDDLAWPGMCATTLLRLEDGKGLVGIPHKGGQGHTYTRFVVVPVSFVFSVRRRPSASVQHPTQTLPSTASKQSITYFTHFVLHPCAVPVGLHPSTFHSANVSISTRASTHFARLFDFLSISLSFAPAFLSISAIRLPPVYLH